MDQFNFLLRTLMEVKFVSVANWYVVGYRHSSVDLSAPTIMLPRVLTTIKIYTLAG